MKTHAKCILMSHGMTKGTNFLVVNHNQMSFTWTTYICIDSICLSLRYFLTWGIKPFWSPLLMPRQIIELGGMYISEEPGLSYLVNKSPTSRSLISQYQVLRFPMKALLMPCLGISKRHAQSTVASTIIYQNNPRLVLHLQIVLLNQLHS